jgi:argininosuccinate synthase
VVSKIVLAYSGGLDTSVLLRRLVLDGHEVLALTAALGESDPASGDSAAAHLCAVRSKALSLGAVDAVVVDCCNRFAESFVLPALRANAMYEGVYPLSAALSRPLIAELLVETARRIGADSIAHGCTGKGNDQVRIEVTARAIDASLRCIAPLRDTPTSRTDAIAFAGTHGIPVTHTLNKPYSIDANLWGRSIEAGALEDPWAAPPEDAYAWTASPGTAEERELVVAFEAGVPVGVDDVRLDFAALIGEMNSLAGKCGVGRIDHVESRLVGFKSREVYEAPAAVVLIAAHRKLEALVLSRDELRFKAGVERRYAELIYDGLWRSPLRSHLDAFVDATQARVTGEVHLRLKRGVIEAAGVRSPFSLYDRGLATYSDGDAFDHRAAEGFIHIWGLPLITTAKQSNQTRPLPSQIEKVVGS